MATEKSTETTVTPEAAKPADVDTLLFALRTFMWQAQSVCAVMREYVRDQVGEADTGMNIINLCDVAHDLLEAGIAESDKIETAAAEAASHG